MVPNLNSGTCGIALACLVPLALLSLAGPAVAQLCVANKDDGKCDPSIPFSVLYRCGPEYTNALSEAQAKARGCKLVGGEIVNRMKFNNPSYVPIGKPANLDFTTFIDTAAISWQASIARVWTVHSLAKEEKIGDESYYSIKTLEFYDCKASSVAMRQVHHYADDEGSGRIVSSRVINDQNLRFVEPIPRSIGEAMLKFVCGLRKN